MHDFLTSMVLGIGLTISIILITRLWTTHARDSFSRKVFWTVVLIIPFAGLLFYLASYTVPPVLPPGARAEGNASGWGLA
jgi:hypothetical protein